MKVVSDFDLISSFIPTLCRSWAERSDARSKTPGHRTDCNMLIAKAQARSSVYESTCRVVGMPYICRITY